jgi:hypothetical protein
MDKKIDAINDGVKIRFFGEVKKEKIVTMVQNCQNGGCQCMSDATKQKIRDIQIDGEDGDVSLTLSGEIAKEEIEAALAKSKIINDSCC